MYRTPKFIFGSLGLDSVLLTERSIPLQDLGIIKLYVFSSPRFGRCGRVANSYLNYYTVPYMFFDVACNYVQRQRYVCFYRAL